MITLTIKMASLMSDIKVKSHMNTARIKDGDDQYAVRAGEENEDELRQDLQDTWNALIGICRKFLYVTDDTAGSDVLSSTLATTDQTLVFDVTYRRSSNIAGPLSQAIHEYLVAGSLRRFYTSAAEANLLQLYAASEKTARDEIIVLLHTKHHPVYQ